MSKQQNIRRTLADLNDMRQGTLTNGQRVIWLFDPESLPEGDHSQMSAFEAFNCETAHAIDPKKPHDMIAWEEPGMKGRHTHLTFIESQEVFDSLLVALADSFKS